MAQNDVHSSDAFFDSLAFRVRPLAVCCVAEGWQLEFTPRPSPIVFYVIDGGGWLQIADECVRLERHTFVIFPAERRKVLGVAHPAFTAVEQQTVTATLDGGMRKLTAGEPPFAVDALCGEVSPKAVGAILFLSGLRSPLVQDLSDLPGLNAMYASLADELAEPRPGFSALATTLLQQSLISILRDAVSDREIVLEWTKGLRDKRIVAAVAAMLSDPAAEHTLDSLAAEAGLSRSSFADRFRAAYGQSPMQILRDIRLRWAALLIKESPRRSVKEIAREVGFQSRSHFSRAFQEKFGRPPSDFSGASDDEAS